MIIPTMRIKIRPLRLVWLVWWAVFAVAVCGWLALLPVFAATLDLEF